MKKAIYGNWTADCLLQESLCEITEDLPIDIIGSISPLIDVYALLPDSMILDMYE